MYEELKGCSLTEVLEKLEKGRIGHRAALAQRQEAQRAGRDRARRPVDARTSADAGGPGNARVAAADIPAGRGRIRSVAGPRFWRSDRHIDIFLPL